MWDYTNYENQVKHLGAAGLNPALLYGQGGGGGASTAGGAVGNGQGTAGQAPSGGSPQGDIVTNDRRCRNGNTIRTNGSAKTKS